MLDFTRGGTRPSAMICGKHLTPYRVNGGHAMLAETADAKAPVFW